MVFSCLHIENYGLVFSPFKTITPSNMSVSTFRKQIPQGAFSHSAFTSFHQMLDSELYQLGEFNNKGYFISSFDSCVDILMLYT